MAINLNNVTVDYIETDNELLGKNIQVHYENFPKEDNGDMIDIHAPEQIFLRTNYPKVNFDYLSDYDTVDFNLNFYKPFADLIVFGIYPIHDAGNNKGIEDYVLMSGNELDNYPSLSITPNGNFISAAILPDKLFTWNGLYSDSATEEPFLTEMKGVKDGSEIKLTKKAFFGGIEREIKTYNWNVDINEQGDYPLSLNTVDYGRTFSTFSSDAKDTEFRYINVNKTTMLGGLTVGKKSQVSSGATSSSTNTTSSSSIGNEEKHVKRVYWLDNYSSSHPDLTTDDVITDEDKESEIAKEANTGLSFFIAFDFLKGTYGTAKLNFGKNIFTIGPKNEATLKVGHGNTTTCDLSYSLNNPPLRPSFVDNDGFKHVQTAMFYPVWNGIAVQPGILNGNPANSYRQGDPPVYPIGTIANEQLNNPKRTTQSKYLEPDYEKWVENGKSGHIRLFPNSPEWASKMKLTLTDCTANFFYMPLFFVPYSKFRMYFSGMKVGDYTVKQDPESKYNYIYVYSGNNESLIAKEWFTEYRYDIKESGQNSERIKVISTYHHRYTGSVIYSYPDIDSFSEQDFKNINFISENVNAVMVPPKAPEGLSEKESLKFWQDYNKTLFFMDFNITNPIFAKNKLTILNNGLPRKPVEIMGVLLTHTRQIENSPIDNENGTFHLSSEVWTDWQSDDDLNSVYQHKTESDCYCPEPWIHYATSISITHNQDGSSGNIILDKYSLMGQDSFPKQSLGGIRLYLENGNKNFIKPNGYITGSSTDRSYIFSGIATEIKHMDSFNSDTIDISLKGLQYKLEDIKLINAPFYDGDDLKTALKWLSKYSGIRINVDKYTADKAADRRLPVSSNFSKPAIMLPGGTPVLDGINEICNSVNHRFIIQPDGVGYVYEMSSEFSIPLVCKPGYIKATVIAEISNDNVMSIDVQPFYGNLYNVVISASLKGTNNTIEPPDAGETVTEIKLNQVVSHMTTEPDLPWSRVIAHSHKGYMSMEQLGNRHKIDRIMSKRYWVNGSITIPGNANVWIYDQIKIFGQYFYVTDVSHTIDFSGKVFRTTLNISQYLTEVGDGNAL